MKKIIEESQKLSTQEKEDFVLSFFGGLLLVVSIVVFLLGFGSTANL